MFFSAYRVLNGRIVLSPLATVFVPSNSFQAAEQRLAEELTKNPGRHFYYNEWLESGCIVGARESVNHPPYVLRFMADDVVLESNKGHAQVKLGSGVPSWNSVLRFVR